jgi:hypothetical protein
MTNTAHIRSRRPAPAAAPVRRRAGLVRPVRPAPPDPVAEAAARYAREGWRVVPLNGERRPTRQGWQDGATADPERAARDCAGNAGVGILAGERRLVVLDIDGQQGEQSLTNLTLHGGSSLPATREILTPGGGRHLHFTTDAALRGRTIAPGLEIKGASRAGRPVAVPMPPSRRAYRDGDRHYAWGADGDRAPAELPATWVEELLRLQQEDDERRAEAMAGTEPRDPAQPVTDYERRWAAETLDRICAGIAGTRSGRRTAINHGALRVGGCLWALDAGEAERRLIEAGRASGWRGDVVRTVRDALRDGAERPVGPPRSNLWDPNRPRSPGANNPAGPDEGAAVPEPANTPGRPEPRRPPLTSFSMDAAYIGAVPEPDWLVRGKIIRSTASMVAAMGGVGKTQSLLRLCHAVAAGTRGRSAHTYQGGEILAEGRAVLVTAQDSRHAIHRRLERAGLPQTPRLIVYPLTNAGGPMHLFRRNQHSGDFAPTDEFLWLEEELSRLDNLQLISFDPLQSFCPIDITTDVSAGVYVGDLLNQFAVELSTTVHVSHHFNKAGQQAKNRDDARSAIRGVTSLVDGMRAVYSIWRPEEKEAERVCAALGIASSDPARDPKEHLRRVYKGAIVKFNDDAEGPEQTYVRRANGWDLIDRTEDVSAAIGPCNGLHAVDPGLSRAIIAAVNQTMADGSPLARTGNNGVFSRRHVLGSEYATLGRAAIERSVTALLAARRLTLTEATRGGRRAQVLTAAPDAPGIGPWARSRARQAQIPERLNDDPSHSFPSGWEG